MQSLRQMGVRVKTLVLRLFEKSQWQDTKAFYIASKFISVQELEHFQIWDFGSISSGKIDKIKILKYLTPNVNFCPN